MSDYGLLIEKLRTIATDPENQKKISSERIREKFEKAHPGLIEKIMQGNDLNLVDRIQNLNETQDFPEILEIEKEFIKNQKPPTLRYTRDDRMTFFHNSTTMPIPYDDVLKIHEEHLKLDVEGFYKNSHPLNLKI